MSDLRVGLVGMGVMGRNHARVLRSLSGVKLVGCADPSLQSEPNSSDIVECENIEELLKLGVDYCVVAVPTAQHHEIGLLLADRGVHALIEKPLAPNSSEARSLAQAFTANGLIGAVGHIERYNPALQEARRRILNGDLGTVHQVATRRQGPFPNRISDVGVIMDLATHDIDLTTWVTGQTYQSVSALCVNRSGREHEDMVAVIGQLSSGCISNHLVDWLSPFKKRTTIITGDSGSFVVDTLTADITYFENGSVHASWEDLAQFRGVSQGNVTRFAIEKPEPLRTEHEAFRDAVNGDSSRIVTMEAGLATVMVAESILRSARSGQGFEDIEGPN